MGNAVGGALEGCCEVRSSASSREISLGNRGTETESIQTANEKKLAKEQRKEDLNNFTLPDPALPAVERPHQGARRVVHSFHSCVRAFHGSPDAELRGWQALGCIIGGQVTTASSQSPRHFRVRVSFRVRVNAMRHLITWCIRWSSWDELAGHHQDCYVATDSDYNESDTRTSEEVITWSCVGLDPSSVLAHVKRQNVELHSDVAVVQWEKL